VWVAGIETICKTLAASVVQGVELCVRGPKLSVRQRTYAVPPVLSAAEELNTNSFLMFFKRLANNN